MNKSDKIIHCRKCKKITFHEVLEDYTARCVGCGNIKDLKNPHMIEAEIVTHGDPRKA